LVYEKTIDGDELCDKRMLPALTGLKMGFKSGFVVSVRN
jgi:hypothetical protein